MLEARRAPTHLAWFVEARRIDVRQFIWIDAHTRTRLLDFSQLTDGRNRSTYDTNGGNALPGTLARSEGGAPTGDSDADAAYNFSGDTYDYFRTQHGLDSYDGAGAALISTVHYCPSNNNCNYQNAFWNGTLMVYGNGFSAADDVDAHELTHAVTEHSANLLYYMQSGALNESFSDIFGETVDLLNGAGTDTAAVRWLLGEDIPGIGAIRNMMNQNVFNDPGKMSDTAQFVCAAPGNDEGGVHTNSGVPNHAYALMVDGETYNAFTITGIGLIKAGKIQYRALSTYLLSASDFLDNCNALKQSCSDLIGTAGITAGDCAEVGKALDAVEMASPWPCSPPQASVPLFCAPGEVPSNVFFDNLENAASGNWAITTLSGVNHWFYPGSVNPFGFGPFATSGVNNFWAYNQPVVRDSAIPMTSSVAIPALARLQFTTGNGIRWPGAAPSSETASGTWPLSSTCPACLDGTSDSGSAWEPGSTSTISAGSSTTCASTCVRSQPRKPSATCGEPPTSISAADLGGTGETALNFTGGAGPAGDTWITVYDTAPADATPTLFTGSVSLSADVLIHRFNNAKGAGLLALYNEGPGKKGLALIVFDNGNSDRLVLATVDQAGWLNALKSVSLGTGIWENAWYRRSRAWTRSRQIAMASRPRARPTSISR